MEVSTVDVVHNSPHPHTTCCYPPGGDYRQGTVSEMAVKLRVQTEVHHPVGRGTPERGHLCDMDPERLDNYCPSFY